MSDEDDIAIIAGQLADLIQAFDRMSSEVRSLREQVERNQEIQRERADRTARGIGDIADRLLAAASEVRDGA